MGPPRPPSKGSKLVKRAGKAAPTPKEAPPRECAGKGVKGDGKVAAQVRETADVGFMDVPNVSKARIRQRPRT